MKRKEIYKIKINLPNGKTIKIWQENGNVVQSGSFALPEILQSFANTPKGRHEAGAFISGIKQFSQIISTLAL